MGVFAEVISKVGILMGKNAKHLFMVDVKGTPTDSNLKRNAKTCVKTMSLFLDVDLLLLKQITKTISLFANNQFSLVLVEPCILNSVSMVKTVFHSCMVVVWVIKTILEVKSNADKGV